MKRYDLVDSHAMGAGMEEHSEGDYVRWDDVSAEIEQLRKEVRSLEEKRLELNVEIGERNAQIESLQAKVHLCAGYDKLTEFVRSLVRRKIHMGWAMWKYETAFDLDDPRNEVWEQVQNERNETTKDANT